MNAHIHNVLQKKFGYTSFRGGQKEIIESVLNQEDVLAILPTGMGKSLCYQLPAYMLPHSILIISPLLSLMQDQVEQLKKMGEKRVVAINSFLNPAERHAILKRLASYKFIFLSPEMMWQEHVQAELMNLPLSLVVVDEAHCISQWGYDFRPDYLRVGEWIRQTSRPPILALTATATSNVMNDISTLLQMSNPTVHVQSLDRPNIRYATFEVDSQDEKYENIKRQIIDTERPGILYTQSRKKADNYAKKLSAEGIRIASYHAGMEPLDRMFIQQQFLQNELDWVCATNAFGMGVHKDDVRQIIHDHIPSSVANYTQEVGRAGRDGGDSLATLYYTKEDEDHSIFVATNDFPEEENVNFYIESINNGVTHSQLVSQSLMSETHVRMISYWLARKSAEETIIIFEDLRKQKIKQIFQMKEILTNPLCIREQLIHVFGQHLIDRPENCCSKCGLNTDAIISSTNNLGNKLVLQQWEDRMAKIFRRLD